MFLYQRGQIKFYFITTIDLFLKKSDFIMRVKHVRGVLYVIVFHQFSFSSFPPRPQGINWESIPYVWIICYRLLSLIFMFYIQYLFGSFFHTSYLSNNTLMRLTLFILVDLFVLSRYQSDIHKYKNVALYPVNKDIMWFM